MGNELIILAKFGIQYDTPLVINSFKRLAIMSKICYVKSSAETVVSLRVSSRYRYGSEDGSRSEEVDLESVGGESNGDHQENGH